MLAISKAGLKARNRLDRFGGNEEHFLNRIEATLEMGRTPAEELLDQYNGTWHGNINRIFEDHAY